MARQSARTTLLVAKSVVKTGKSLLLLPGSGFLGGLVSTLTSFPRFRGADGVCVQPRASARADRCVFGADLLHSAFQRGADEHPLPFTFGAPEETIRANGRSLAKGRGKVLSGLRA